MPAGTMVYHAGLRANLIVCQVNAKGKIICINPKVFDNDKYQVITVNPEELTVGWKTLYD